MNFRDVPNLQKFEEHARAHSSCEITIDAYRRVREIIGPVDAPAHVVDFNDIAPLNNLKASCAAIEKATRVLWACAAATNHVLPPLWNYLPDYESALQYFTTLSDIELMAVTKEHHLDWNQTGAVPSE
jgi:hypothetical protein